MKQNQIAKKFGLSPGQISKIFNGKQPGKKTAMKIAEITGRDWWEYFGMTASQIRSELEAALSKDAA